MTEDISPAADLARPLKFAYWVPNVSGGLVISTVEQRTDWGIDYNRTLARTAEQLGFEYALTQTRYQASYGASSQHEATSFSLALLLATEKLKVIAAVHPGMWHPGVLAKFINTTDQLSGGRAAVNIVSGWLKDEFTGFGLPWLEHDERYVRTDEFIRALRGIWTEESYSQFGRHYAVDSVTLNPGPVTTAVRTHPEIFFGGNSTAAQATAGRVADWYFSNGRTLDDYANNVAGVLASAESGHRSAVEAPRFGVNGFVIARDTRAEAIEQLREIVAHAHRPAVEGFQKSVQQAGSSTSDRRGMWADSSFEDLVQYNDGFKTGLIGTYDEIAERIVEYKKRGVHMILTAYLHFQEELTVFGEEIIPRVRALEAQLARSRGVDFCIEDPALAA